MIGVKDKTQHVLFQNRAVAKNNDRVSVFEPVILQNNIQHVRWIENGLIFRITNLHL